MDTADIRLIRIFVRVVEAGGLSAAQADLNMSLSTISEKITALEQRFGVTLCKRGRSGFSLTENGRQVYEESLRLLGSVEQFGMRVTGLRSQMSGPLRIGIVDSTITDPRFPLAASLNEFMDIAPYVQLTLETRSPGELLREVVSQNLHLAIGSFPKVSLGLNYLDLYDELHNLYCASNHPLFAASDSEIDVEMVRMHRIIGRSYWAARDIKIFAIASPHASVSNMEAEAHLILSGKFIGYLPDHFAEIFVKSGRIRPLRPDLFSYKARFQIAVSPEFAARPTVKSFIDIVQKVHRSGVKT